MERRFVKIEKGLGPQGRIAVVRFDRGDNINALSQRRCASCATCRAISRTISKRRS